MKVVILAGGYGTRISEESHLKPKPMIEIGGKPILWHIMKEYSYYGFNDFIICCGYKQNIIKQWFADYYLYNSDVTFDFSDNNKMTIHNNVAEPWKVTLVDTGLDTLTGGRVKRIEKYIGDEPFMLASNLPGVAVVVDKNRVKAGRYAIRHFGSDVLILDDGFQYMKLKHSHEIVLVDSTNPFGNGHLLPRGILREPAENIKRADFIFITKSDGNTDALRARLRTMNEKAEIAECRHRPRYYKNAFSSEILPLEAVKGMKVVTLSGIAAPMSFEKSVMKMGAKILSRERYPDHYRYKERDIIDVIDNAAELKADAILTTEKDAVRLPRLQATKVPIYYMRMDIEIIKGFDNFRQCVNRICMD
jgi:tetraacyldisaccharide 4'-kinase